MLGQPLPRIDGRKKVTGRANYAGDNPIAGVVHVAGVTSPIAQGRIVELDTAEAEKAPGVLRIFHPRNCPRLRRCPEDMGNKLKASEDRTPFEDDRIYYAGQFVALVVAETFEQARWAAHLVRATYAEGTPALSLEAGLVAHGAKPQPDETYHRGDAKRAFEKSAVQIDATYTTPVEVHCAMEPHTTLAEWREDKLIVHDSTQWVVGQARSLAYVLGLPPEKLEVRAPFVGGGFGSKLFLWPHTILAALAARELRRPVKFVLPRQHHFTTAGHRPCTRQRLRLGASSDGRLASISHETQSHTSLVTNFVESCGEATPSLYACPAVSVTQSIVPVNVGSPTSMRAPGAAPGTFALESAMDELAAQLGLDPIELRRRNVPAQDGATGLPWSSNHFTRCLEVVEEGFGWKQRKAEVGTMRTGREILGWGFAAATWPAYRSTARVRVELRRDGTVSVATATQDIGTGTYTVIAQVVAEITTLPLSRIEVAIGSSVHPPGPISGGSMATATVVPAVAAATRKALDELRLKLTHSGAAFAGADFRALTFQSGSVRSPDGRTMPFNEAVATLEGTPGTPTTEARASAPLIAVEASAQPGEERSKYAFRSFGAHCVEVRWDPGIARLRVTRIVSAFDAGRIINAKTARNQIEGALMMGLGMALLEHAVYDGRNGRVVTDSLADYLVPVHADVPELDVTFLDLPDPHIGDFGARGLGEIGITGISAAIANAVYHATGHRHRDLPITIEQLLK